MIESIVLIYIEGTNRYSPEACFPAKVLTLTRLKELSEVSVVWIIYGGVGERQSSWVLYLHRQRSLVDWLARTGMRVTLRRTMNGTVPCESAWVVKSLRHSGCGSLLMNAVHL